MKLITKYPKFFFQLTVYFSTFIYFILNILLNKFVNLWFNHPGLYQMASSCMIVITLTSVRISAIHFSPKA
jgi:hypothetical protein